MNSSLACYAALIVDNDTTINGIVTPGKLPAENPKFRDVEGIAVIQWRMAQIFAGSATGMVGMVVAVMAWEQIIMMPDRRDALS